MRSAPKKKPKNTTTRHKQTLISKVQQVFDWSMQPSNTLSKTGEFELLAKKKSATLKR
jgi:hypothetical protein